MVSAIYDLMGKCVDPPTTAETKQAHAEDAIKVNF